MYTCEPVAYAPGIPHNNTFGIVSKKDKQLFNLGQQVVEEMSDWLNHTISALYLYRCSRH
jgi:hypothetical protein